MMSHVHGTAKEMVKHLSVRLVESARVVEVDRRTFLDQSDDQKIHFFVYIEIS